jgi:hypothetical protein
MEQGTRALVRALGYPDAIRFLLAVHGGKGDYTKERRALLKGVSLEELLAASDRIVAREKGRKRRKSA